MPQMAPISWLILFILFSVAFLMFNVLNYFCFNNKSSFSTNNSGEQTLLNNESKNINWKW